MGEGGRRPDEGRRWANQLCFHQQQTRATYFPLKIFSLQCRTLLISNRSPLNSICLTGFVPFSLSRLSKLVISIKRTSANSNFSFPTARSSSSEKVPITSITGYG